MTTVNKKRVRISSPASNSDDEDQRNPKPHENGIIGDDCRGKRLKSNTCYACDGKDNWVLVCHGEECLIAIHQSCTSDEPDFDEFGNFYCPYCWYKRVVVKSLKLQEKLMVIEKSRKGRETLGVDMGVTMDEVSKDIENVVEVNVSGGRRVTSVNLSGNRRQSDESYEKFKVSEKFKVMEKDQRMREVVAESHSGEDSETGDDDVVDEGRQQRGRFSEKSHKTSDAPISNARCSEKSHEKVQVSKGVNTRKQRIYSEKSQQNKRLAGTHEKDVFINDKGTQARNSDLGEGTSGLGCCHENNQQKKALSTESCEQEVHRTAKRVSHGSRFGGGKYRQGRHIEKNQHNRIGETETQEKEVSRDVERMEGAAVVRDGDEFFLVENQDRQSQADMRNDVATFNEQENGFEKDEQIGRNSASSISSPISTDNVNDSNAASQELALIIHPGVQERPIEAQPFRSAPPMKPSFQHEKSGHKSYLEKNRTASNDLGQRKVVLCSDKKRKRQFWTQAEEEMLRVGVQKFPGFRNIPWRKILEFGRDVFHDERVPSDLKDKWKNMNKMSSETGKLVSLSTERKPNHLVSEACSE